METTDSTPLLYISVLAFFAIFLTVLGVAALLDTSRGRRDLRARVAGGTGSENAAPTAEQGTLGYFRELILGLLEKLGQANQDTNTDKTTPQGPALSQRLTSAGYRRQSAPAIFTGVKVLLAILLPLIVWLLPIRALDQGPLVKSLLAYLVLAAVGLYGPELWLHRASEARKTRITNGFPDALDLLVVCIEAGLGLDAAIFRTGVELEMTHPDLCEELHLVSLELRAGLQRSQALTNLGWRADIPEVKSLVALLIQTDRFGTSVGQALRVHSDSMRTARTQRAEEAAGKLPVKLLFPLMFFIFPSLFIVILGPAVIQGMRVLMPTMDGK